MFCDADTDTYVTRSRYYPNRSVNTLHLAHNAIGDRGAMAIGQVLESNTTITELDLSFNHVKRRGAAAIANALQTNGACGLQQLDLSHNLLSDESALCFASAMELNQQLQRLDLSDNRVDLAGGKIAALVSESAGKRIVLASDPRELLAMPESATYGKAEPFARQRLPQITSPSRRQLRTPTTTLLLPDDSA
eukprot:SAG25_NODE_3_length_30426_cov_8.268210_32_plen_192_part_00